MELRVMCGEQGELSDQFLDISRIERDLGWAPKFTIDTLLSDYIASRLAPGKAAARTDWLMSYDATAQVC